MWGHADIPTIHNRGAVADPAHLVMIQCHQRWQTMLNRGWSASVTCGVSDALHLFGFEDVEHYCTSSRHISLGLHFLQAAPHGACQRLSMVQRLWRFFANLRHTYRGAQNANYLNLQPLCGCVYWGDCCYPHVADCASLIVNMGLLRLQPLRGCAANRL